MMGWTMVDLEAAGFCQSCSTKLIFSCTTHIDDCCDDFAFLVAAFDVMCCPCLGVLVTPMPQTCLAASLVSGILHFDRNHTETAWRARGVVAPGS